MSEHKATITWAMGEGEFLKGKYTREHTWAFDGGLTVPASASPSVVPVPMSNPANVDPEEAFVASVSSCHMLTYLFVAYRQKIEVAEYVDDAVGVMTKNEAGVQWISSIVLAPRITYRGTQPTPEQEEKMHEAAHHGCFISNSVKTEITVQARR
jgi:organic hydroperoxide reductase OsmC/OhrA